MFLSFVGKFQTSGQVSTWTEVELLVFIFKRTKLRL